MEVVVKTQESPRPPLAPSLPPVMLYNCGRGGADPEEGDGGGSRLVYSIPTRQLLLAGESSGRFVDDANWITAQGDPFTSRTVGLPPDRERLLAAGSHDTRCVMSTRRPTDPGCVVVVIHATDPVLCYCHPRGSRWFRHVYRPELLVTDDRFGRDDIIDTVAWHTAAASGRIYTWWDDKLATLEFTPDPTLSTTRVVGMPEGCLVESCGDLFMVLFCGTSVSGDLHTLAVEVQKLEWSRSAWVKVTALGSGRMTCTGGLTRAGFVRYLPAPPDSLAPNSNPSPKGNTETGTVRSGVDPNQAIRTTEEEATRRSFVFPASCVVLTVHTFRRTKPRRRSEPSAMEDTTSLAAAQEERGWSSLPTDLLKAILDLLPWSSHPRFAAACKHWRSALSPFYPASITPLLLSAADIGATNLCYYSPYYHKNFEVARTLDTPYASLFCANGHRLTLCQRTRTDDPELIVVHADLSTGKIWDLFPLERTSFDFVVYNGARRMFGINTLGGLKIARAIETHDGRWHDWEFMVVDHDWPRLYVSPTSNPVLHRGLLDLLGVDGRLAVHDDSRFEEGFEVLDMPRGFGFESDSCYLFESDESELMAVSWATLNEERMEWERVESLEVRALFTGTLTTTMVKTKFRWMQNKVFTPRLYDWPETVRVDLVDRGGEVAFVPPRVARASGHVSWPGAQEATEFWETIRIDHSIWPRVYCTAGCASRPGRSAVPAALPGSSLTTLPVDALTTDCTGSLSSFVISDVEESLLAASSIPASVCGSAWIQSPEEVYSVWALPPEPARRRICRLMAELRAAHGGPAFEPHVTVVGAILEALRAAAAGVRPYIARVVSNREGFYRCGCLLLEPTPEVSLFAAVATTLQLCYDFAYVPHVSLIYGDRTEEQEAAAMRKVQELDEDIRELQFEISDIALYKTDPEDVDSWELVEACNLTT
ncbi:hypothetical protein HU200_042272 [Digitaria exilis]|uniref:F-box domain-containing protein n=1 Tax=Digitaria exilis TaxID=1010633 RepID=A0A835B5B2_9POAL|nr:hypothetical protein HU200_042272 [Digitaria exilis]